MLNQTREMIWKKTNLIREREKKRFNTESVAEPLFFSAVMPADVVVKQAWGYSFNQTGEYDFFPSFKPLC